MGSMMEMITKKLTLMGIEEMPNVIPMPHTTVKKFSADGVEYGNTCRLFAGPEILTWRYYHEFHILFKHRRCCLRHIEP
jgi:hypothetical protein